MKIPRILISASSSGSGKTMITCGIMEALKRRGLSVSPFKCGPDYIDTMFHRVILNLPSKNLDSFLADERTLKKLFVQGAKDTDISVIEGVMGYYDGMGFDTTKASSFDVAKITKTPTILVVDAKGMGLSAAATIKGFLEMDKDSGIKGVILNRITKMTYLNLKPVIENRLGINVIGFVPEEKDCRIESRHLGLKAPTELEDIKMRLSKMADLVEENIDIELLLKIARDAKEIDTQARIDTANSFGEQNKIKKCNKSVEMNQEIRGITDYKGVKIAVAYDEAFCFYYEDNLNLLKKFGAQLQFFSPLKDKKLPVGCNGILLGGGYPEIYAKPLSENKEMLEDIKNAFKCKMPIVAECGGFLYLHREIEDLEHNVFKMAGIIDAKAVYTGKLSRFGYIEISLNKMQMYGNTGDVIRGHEFHYYDSENNGCAAVAAKPSKKRSWECIHGNEFFEAGFPHLYYYSNVSFAENFVKACSNWSGIRTNYCGQ